MPHTPEIGYNHAMTESELRKIAEYVDEIVHGLHEWDYRGLPPFVPKIGVLKVFL